MPTVDLDIKPGKTKRITFLTEDKYVQEDLVFRITAGTDTPMVFRGTVGTGGTYEWSNLPDLDSSDSDSDSHEGEMYKVITAPEAGQGYPDCKVGDIIISNGSEWVVVPSGDETLTSLSDTTISSPANGQVLTYDSAAGKWKNANAAGYSEGALIDITNNTISHEVPLGPFYAATSLFDSQVVNSVSAVINVNIDGMGHVNPDMNGVEYKHLWQLSQNRPDGCTLMLDSRNAIFRNTPYSLPTTIGSADGDLMTSDGSTGTYWSTPVFVKYSANQGLSEQQKTNARNNIGASNLTLGNTSSDAASATHVHGDITNGGDITATGVTIENGDALMIRDSSESKLAKTSITFDGTTTNQFLSRKGTWETGGGSVGTLDTTSTIELTPSSSESFGGSISLHKVSKSGKFTDLVGVSVGSEGSGDILVYDSTNGVRKAKADFDSNGNLELKSSGSYITFTVSSFDEISQNLHSGNGTISYGTTIDTYLPSTSGTLALVGDNSHVHGNITSGGTITSDTAIGNGDKIAVVDASDNKIQRSPIEFDGSTKNQFLSKKGTWESLSGGSLISISGNTISHGTSGTGSYWAAMTGMESTLINNVSVVTAVNIDSYGHVATGDMIDPGVDMKQLWQMDRNRPDGCTLILDSAHSRFTNTPYSLPNYDGTSGQVLTTDGSGSLSWTTVQSGGGGVSDYTQLTSKPQINGNTLQGNKTSSQLGLADGNHSHGNITNNGKINQISSLANGDAIVVTSSNGDVKCVNITFDGSTTNQYLSKKGTWEMPVKYITLDYNSGTDTYSLPSGETYSTILGYINSGTNVIICINDSSVIDRNEYFHLTYNVDDLGTQETESTHLEFVNYGIYGSLTKRYVYIDDSSVVSVYTTSSGGGDPMVSKTYAQLAQKVEYGLLVPGQKYRLTNFVTTCEYTEGDNNMEIMSAGHGFDLILTAVSERKFSHEAQAIEHQGETYFSGKHADLSKWKIWYDFEGGYPYSWSANIINYDYRRDGRYDQPGQSHPYAWHSCPNGGVHDMIYTDTKFPTTSDYYWSSYDDTESGTQISDVTAHYGDIYRMIDEFGNDCPYDFKNIMFGRYLSGNGIADDSFITEQGCDIPYMSDYIGNNIPGYDYISGTVEYFYTFSSIFEEEGSDGENFEYSVRDATLEANTELFAINASKQRNIIHSNVMKPFYTTRTVGPELEIQRLNDIVMMCFNDLGNVSNKNEYYTKGFNCHGNTFDINCHSMTIGNNCTSNTFDRSNYCMVIGKGSYCNTFNYGCHGILTGKNFTHNHIGNQDQNCKFGNNFQYNTVGDQCMNLTMGNYNIYNEIHNDCDAILTLDYTQRCVIGPGNKGINFTNSGTATGSSNKLQYLNITQGTFTNQSSPTSYDVDGMTARSYETKIAKRSDGTLADYCEADSY